jgi:hypothetical protein
MARPLVTQVCPACNGAGHISLTKMQFKIWDALRKAVPYGIETRDLVNIVYGDRADGGPENARNCIWAHAYHANKKLAGIGQRIVSTGGPGSVYKLEIGHKV